MKQARAFGLGVVLATQNPVDLDYKGLSNAGLWFLGRLQTARDKARVLDGLEGAAQASGGSFDRSRLDRLLSGLEQRRFLMHSVHGDEETLFQTRWTMAYLRGPLLRDEIKRLTAASPAPASNAAAATPATMPSSAAASWLLQSWVGGSSIVPQLIFCRAPARRTSPCKGTLNPWPHVLGGTHPLCSRPSRHLLPRAAHPEGTSSFCFFWCFLVHTLYTLVNLFSSGHFIPLCLCDLSLLCLRIHSLCAYAIT